MSDQDIEKLTSFLAELNDRRNTSSSTYDTPNKGLKVKTPEDLQKCVRDNEHCVSLLNMIESSLYLLLENCQRELKLVNANIETLTRRRHSKISSSEVIPTYIGKIFCMPYFKDENEFSHPSNDDVLKRRVQGYLNPSDVLVPRSWNELERSEILSYIRKVEEENWTQTLKACGMHCMANVEGMSLSELVEERHNEYDWLKLSVSSLKNMHSAHECRSMWFTCLHPQINKHIWTEEESKTLQNLVKQCKGQDWDNIAIELGTKRSAFQCIKRFKKHFCEQNKSLWAESEIELLKQYVQVFRFRRFIPWRKLKLYMDGRNSSELFRMWNKINQEGKPRTFSLEEDIVLVAGMRIYGSKYPKIKEYLPDRSVKQVCRRIEVLKRRQFPRHPWSTQEDKLLIELVEKYGFGNWMKISMHFVNRDESNIRSRYTTLQRCMEKYGSHESCASVMVRNPRSRIDVVNLKLLWETAQKMSEQNQISTSVTGVMERSPTVNIVKELSQLLKPEMRHNKDINVEKLKHISRRGFSAFFQGAYTQNEEHLRTHKKVKIVCSPVYNVLMTLKLLEGKIILPATEEVEEDKSISELDKQILKFLITNNINISKINSIEREYDKFVLLFPPNFSTLVALRSILLNHQNLKEQAEGLTTQVDNIEWKHVNSCCPPQRPCYSENYNVASKLWNERVNVLLDCVIPLLNKESAAYSSALNVLIT